MKVKVILSATSTAWGHLFTEEDKKREIENFKKFFEELRRTLPEDLTLEIHSFIDREDEIRFVESLSKDDPVLYVALSFSTPGLDTLLANRNPMIFFQKMYAGHTWIISRLRRNNIILFMGSNLGDLARKIRVLYTFKKIKETKYILVTERKHIVEKAENLYRRFNFQPILIKPENFLEYFEMVPKSIAEKEAKAFVDKSVGVIEPSFNEIVDAYRFYLGMKKAIYDKDADGITIDCLSLFGKTLPAYPCVGFSLLNSEGIPAACEGDSYSLLMMFIYKYLGDKPSFISDPVIDISKNTVVHAHCVAPIRFDGIKEYPYIIRSHAEDDKSVSLEVKYDDAGSIITVANILDNCMVVSRGRLIGNPEINRGCRTKIEISVDNAYEMLWKWHGGEHVSAFGLHRVLAVGDWYNELKELSRLMGLKFVEE